MLNLSDIMQWSTLPKIFPKYTINFCRCLLEWTIKWLFYSLLLVIWNCQVSAWWCYLVHWAWELGFAASALAERVGQENRSEKHVAAVVLGGAFLHLHKQGLHTICHPLYLNKMHSPSPLFVPGSESKAKRHSSGFTSLSGLEVSSLSWPSCLVIEQASSKFLASNLTYSSDSVRETCHYSSVKSNRLYILFKCLTWLFADACLVFASGTEHKVWVLYMQWLTVVIIIC